MDLSYGKRVPPIFGVLLATFGALVAVLIPCYYIMPPTEGTGVLLGVLLSVLSGVATLLIRYGYNALHVKEQ